MAERKALFTDRLTLEPMGPDHADGLIAAKEQSIEELRPWLAWAGDDDPNSTRAFVHACQQEWDVTEWTFTILLDGEIIGAVGVNRFDPMVSTANLGYWLRDGYGGPGPHDRGCGRGRRVRVRRAWTPSPRTDCRARQRRQRKGCREAGIQKGRRAEGRLERVRGLA